MIRAEAVVKDSLTADPVVTIRPATLADFEHWHGGPPYQTVRAWVGLVDGRPVAFAGFTLHRSFVEAFSNFVPDHGLTKKCVYRYAKLMLAEMRKYRLPLMAAADPERQNSGKFLERLGFTFLEHSPTGDLYTCK